MSTDDALRDRGRALEEEYFRRKDRELIEKIRQRSVDEETKRALGATAGVDDTELVHELHALGFTPETVKLLPFLPVLQVAWAEGGVTPVERYLIEKLATTREITPGSEADAQLMDWLAARPSEDVFAGATRLISALLEAGAPVLSDLTADQLLRHCEQVASVSGGMLGIGGISSEERELLKSISADLKNRD